MSQNNPQNIPFLDLVTPHVELESELTAVFQQVIRTAGFIGGPMVENFEKEFAAFCHTERSIAVNSGADALRFALMAAGVKDGDVAITVPNTFIVNPQQAANVIDVEVCGIHGRCLHQVLGTSAGCAAMYWVSFANTKS